MAITLDTFRDFNFYAIVLRMVLALLCGGIVGIERAYKRRPAGFRTHILICLGASITVLTSQYLALVMHYFTDIARMGAQVVAGIGFIGAGTIIVTRSQRVKGLTTAAGLWASAIIGLCIGAGFYEGALIATGIILLLEIVFSRMEHWFLNRIPEINVYVEYRDKQCLELLLRQFRDAEIRVLNMEITRSVGNETHNACAIFALRLPRKTKVDQVLSDLNQTEGVLLLEEI